MIRRLRLDRGWSQDQLAELSGLSVRTIQRLEQGHKAGLESQKALAAVFEIELRDLQLAQNVSAIDSDANEREQILGDVRELKDFYSHLISYVLVIVCLLVVNLVWVPSIFWVHWVALGWGIGLTCHAVDVFKPFTLFGADWERKQFEKRLNRRF